MSAPKRARCDGSDDDEHESVHEYPDADEVVGEDGAEWLEGMADGDWHRQPVVASVTETLSFQWLEGDSYYRAGPLAVNPVAGVRMPGARIAGQATPVIRMYGVTSTGATVTAHIHGFTPYFYVGAPGWFGTAHVRTFTSALEGAVRGAKKAASERCSMSVLGCELVPHMASLVPNRITNYIKIYMALPTLVGTARGILERGLAAPGLQSTKYACFEAGTPFLLRYMIDCDVRGSCWVSLLPNTYSVRSTANRTSSAQIEVEATYESLIAHPPEAEWQLLAPFRILSFDIECAGRHGIFPQAEHDAVIQIANIVSVTGGEPEIRNIFVIGSCTPIVGATVLSFSTEEAMLDAWSRFVRETDPDILTGYNIAGFDIPYLLNRGRILGIASFALLGRLNGIAATMKSTSFANAAWGKNESIQTTISGRLVFDMLLYARRNLKLSSYTLNAVASSILAQQKEDVHHSAISALQAGSADDRRRLAVYCLKDAWLPLRLMEKLHVLVNTVEMSRVTGVPIEFLLSRGQQIKVVSMLYRKCMRMPGGRLLVPTRAMGAAPPASADVGYEGATVLSPKTNFYDEPIATLDFASLYPSIMQAHNLCYSTLLTNPGELIVDVDYEVTPTGDMFLKASRRRGVLPLILDELLAARKRAKRDMESASDPAIKAVQNGRQLALKISANSVYGFTGATVGQLPCLQISASVTAYGREMINATKNAVEATFTIANGYAANADVVYGDTDSVMVKFGAPGGVPEAMRLGLIAAKQVSGLFPVPVKLEFEKVYYPFLLMNKKRYAGLYWTKPDKYDKMDTKGIETVRRDNCALVRRVLEEVLHRVLIDRSIASAIDYCKHVIGELLQGKIDLSLLVITKALAKSADASGYKVRQAHVELAEKMKKRDAGSAPHVGDRVAYVIIQAAKGTKTYAKSEDPLYVLEHNLPIDANYYLEKQLKGPLMRIFEHVLARPQDLFCGEHTRAVIRPLPTSGGGMLAFARRVQTCLGCKTPVATNAPLCSFCAPNEAALYLTRVAEVRKCEARFSDLWTECQRCQESLYEEVLCTSRDCAIFYMRKKVQKDLTDNSNALARFDW